MTITKGRILRYMTLPEILPRARDLLGSGFGFIAYCMASIFENAGLLAHNHPYLRPANIGQFGILHVLGQAALNLKFKYRHLDQVILFLVMLLGLVLLFTQGMLLAVSAFMQAAHAAPVPMSFASFFESPDPANDISFMLMDRIFGIPGIFNSCVAQGNACLTQINPSAVADPSFPQPYHLAFHNMLEFYSHGLLLLSAIILAYYVVSILAETSETGTPFGKRFNRAWAPLRIVFALGLLVPMTHNLNAAQYITLYIAKFGSAFGTNGWNLFLDGMGVSDDPANPSTLTGDREMMVAKPQYPTANEIIQFMATAHTCRSAYKKMYGIDISAYAVREASPFQGGTHPSYRLFMDLMNSGLNYYQIQEWFGLADVVIAFGEQKDSYTAYKGTVRPYCGMVTVPSVRFIKPEGGAVFHDGVDFLAYGYLAYIVLTMWDLGGSGGNGISLANIGEIITGHTLPIHKDTSQPIPGQEAQKQILDSYNGGIASFVDGALQLMRQQSDWSNDAKTFGWAGAGIWYNKIAETNGIFTEAVFSMPYATKYPEIMEWVKEERGKNDTALTGSSVYEPNLANGENVMDGRDERDKAILSSLFTAYSMWNDFTREIQPPSSGNGFIDAVHAVFGKIGLWSLRENEAVHPLASMSSMGKSLLIKSVYAFGGGVVTGGISGAFGLLGKKDMPKAIANNLSSFLLTVAFIGLTAGIMLYYVVPFLPFIYFIFAVLGWAKTIFEAMIGVPLWALAHLRYDGEGFPPEKSLYGYYLLLDIFLRPILIVFGLIASVVTFYALARTLNNVFDTVTANLTGFDLPAATAPSGPAVGQSGSLEQFRSAVDQLFFTIIYAFIVYMIGMSCFKMIDQFPNSILRWMGSTATGLGSLTQDDSGQRLEGNMQTGIYHTNDAARSMASQVTGRQFGENEG